MNRIAPIACAALLLGVAIWEIAATVRAASSVPGDAAWQAAARVVREQHRPGDLIVFAPAWADPIGRLHLGDLIPIEMAARMDDARYGRIWELSIRGAHRDEAPAFESSIHGIAVRRYERTPATVLADVRELLPQARVAGAFPQLVLAEVGFAPRRCVQVVPAPSASPTRIAFTLPAGTLVGYAGLADVFTRRDIRAPATLEVNAGDRVVASVTPGVDDGWVRFEAAIPGGEVTFVASAAAPNRLLCFAAEVRR